MSADPAITCESLSKCYRLRSGDRGLFARVKNLGKRQPDVYFEALTDITFSIPKGSSLALIGPNGSGKSTLLRILSGITPASSGRAVVNGRIGAMLELGGSFHPNLTGYENIFQTGAVLGMPRAEIQKRLRDIEDFCELGDFLMAPTRTYSMGMLLRLAFAIEINMDPDILIIDEALAVGDSHFQKKCSRWLLDYRRSGRTLLFVSHMAELSESICDQAVWLDKGRLKMLGSVGEVSKAYHGHVFKDMLEGDPKHDQDILSALLPQSRFGKGGGTIKDVRISDEQSESRSFFYEGEPVCVSFVIDSTTIDGELAAYLIIELAGQPVAFYDSYVRGNTLEIAPGESRQVFLTIPGHCLMAGVYYVTVAVGRAGDHDVVFDCHQKVYHFAIRPVDPDGRISLGFLHIDGGVEPLAAGG